MSTMKDNNKDNIFKIQKFKYSRIQKLIWKTIGVNLDVNYWQFNGPLKKRENIHITKIIENYSKFLESNYNQQYRQLQINNEDNINNYLMTISTMFCSQSYNEADRSTVWEIRISLWVTSGLVRDHYRTSSGLHRDFVLCCALLMIVKNNVFYPLLIPSVKVA